MATSGSYSWELTRNEIIAGALRKVGAIDENDTPSTAQYTTGATALNGVIKNTPGLAGMPLWGIDQTNFALTASATYTLGIGQTVNIPRPIKILQCWHRDTNTNYDTPINIISIDQYNGYGSKFTTGTPVNICYNPDISTGVISVYPYPDTYSIANRSIYIRYHRTFQDVSSGTNTLDFPSEWMEALIYQLAVRLAPEYGVPPNDRNILKAEAKEYTEMAMAQEYENASILLQPMNYLMGK